MLIRLKLLLVAFILLSLTACKDLLSKPLASATVPDSPKPLVGDWASEDGSKRLSITKATGQDWYQFRYQEGAKKTEGRFVISYFKQRMVFNVNLATVRVDNRPVINTDMPAYLLMGAILDGESLQVAPAQMDKFEKHFADYFYASPMDTKTLCKQALESCAENFAAGNLLLSKRLRKFNDEFMKKYRTIFPRRDEIAFLRQ